jgi:hypothetical protein
MESEFSSGNQETTTRAATGWIYVRVWVKCVGTMEAIMRVNGVRAFKADKEGLLFPTVASKKVFSGTTSFRALCASPRHLLMSPRSSKRKTMRRMRTMLSKEIRRHRTISYRLRSSKLLSLSSLAAAIKLTYYKYQEHQMIKRKVKATTKRWHNSIKVV